MDDAQARDYYVKIKTTREKVEQLSEHINEIDEKTVEIRSMIHAVQNLTELNEGDDILAPLTNGVMIPAKAKKPQMLYLNVGAGTVVQKTPEQTIEILEKQQQELTTYRKKMRMQRDELAQEAKRIEEEVTQKIQDDV